VKIAAQWPRDVRDACANFFGLALRGLDPDIAPNARVLEIGCAEYDWLTPAHEAWPEMVLTGIDWRSRKARPGFTTIQADVLAHDFPLESFDWIVSISAIEHVGLGHYDVDPKRLDGDTVTMGRAWSWLKPGGLLYVDVPWNSGSYAYEVHGTSHRVYDDASVMGRLIAPCVGASIRHTAIALGSDTGRVVDAVPRLRGGDEFYYFGMWLQKPAVNA
jgi:hypothetical protein